MAPGKNQETEDCCCCYLAKDYIFAVPKLTWPPAYLQLAGRRSSAGYLPTFG